MKNNLLNQRKPIKPASVVLGIFLFWIIIALLVFPNVSMIINMFVKEGSFSTNVLAKLFSSDRAKKALLNTIVLAMSLIVTVNIVGIALILFTEYFDIKGSKILKAGYMSTLIYGGIILSSGYKFVYGPAGIITKMLTSAFPEMDPNWFTGYFAVLFIMTFACTSNHLIFLTNALRGIDYQTVEAAKNMGASSGKIFFEVVLPVLRPSLFAVTILTFITGLSAMSAPLLVGGADFQTINPLIVTLAKSEYSRDIASLLSVILGIATIILLFFMNKIEKKGNYMSISKVKTPLVKQKINNPVVNALTHALAYFLLLIYMIPISLVVLYSFTNSTAITTGSFTIESFTLSNYGKLFTSANAYKPYLISIIYSILAAVLVALLALCVSRIVQKSKNKLGSALEYGMLIPWFLPKSLIALGLIMTYNVARPIMFNKVLINSLGLLLIGYIIVKIPFSLRMIKASLFGVDGALEEASQSMGASSLYTLRKVIVPIVFPSVVSVIALNFNSLLTDYDLTVLLHHTLLTPLGPVIKAASDETASLDAKAMSFVYAVVVMIISAIALYIVYGDKPKFKKKSFKKG